MYELDVNGRFSAAHCLRGYQGKCERLHGHNYRVRLTVSGDQLDSRGLLVDFKELKRSLADALESLDHFYLNELEFFSTVNPSAENIAAFLFHELAPRVQVGSEGRARLIRVRVWETEEQSASFLGLQS